MSPSLFTKFAGRWCDDCRLAIELKESSARCPSCGCPMRPADITVEPTDTHGAKGSDPAHQDRMDALRLHLKLVHHNESALNLTNKQAVEQHHDEHRGPGGLRNHNGPDFLHDWQWAGGVRDPERTAS